MQEKGTITIREKPFSVGDCPIVIFLRNLSFVSSTARNAERKMRSHVASHKSHLCPITNAQLDHLGRENGSLRYHPLLKNGESYSV